MKIPKYILGLAAIPFAISPTHAAVLAFFVDGTDADGFALANKITPTAGYSVTTLTNLGFDGGGLTTRNEFSGANPMTPAGSVAGSSAGSQWLFMRASTTGNTPISTGAYNGFTVTGTGGNLINLTNLRFNFVVAVNNDFPAYDSLTATAQVFASVNGGAFTAIGSAISAFDDDAAVGFGTVQTANIDLSGITGASSVELRIGVGDSSDTSSYASWIQGIELNGAIIPEPSSFALLVSALSVLSLRRKR